MTITVIAVLGYRRSGSTLRPFLSNRGLLKGSVNYHTKQSWREWTEAATAGGWPLVCQCNYVPWRFRAPRRLWQGSLGRRTLCDKYFAYYRLQD